MSLRAPETARQQEGGSRRVDLVILAVLVRQRQQDHHQQQACETSEYRVNPQPRVNGAPGIAFNDGWALIGPPCHAHSAQLHPLSHLSCGATCDKAWDALRRLVRRSEQQNVVLCQCRWTLLRVELRTPARTPAAGIPSKPNIAWCAAPASQHLRDHRARTYAEQDLEERELCIVHAG